MVALFTAERSPTTWNRYALAIGPWREFAAREGSSFLPASPDIFARFLAWQCARERGYAQTKARVCAIDALSTLAGVASPSLHPDVTAIRGGARRLKTYHRGQSRPIFQDEIPRAADAAAAGDGVRRHPKARRPYIPALAYAAAAMLCLILSDGALRFDDLVEAELGDILRFPGVVQLALFGTKTDTRREGQLAILPDSADPATGYGALLEGIRAGLTRLLTLPADVLAALGAPMRAHLAARYPGRVPGPEAMSTWPGDIRSLADRLYRLGIPAHALPVYGRWLTDELGPSTDLREGIPYREFVKVARGVLARSGANVDGFGAHSFRRGIAAELALRRMSKPDIAALLRHRSLASTQTYILPSAQAATMASSRRSVGM
jgi:integrase